MLEVTAMLFFLLVAVSVQGAFLPVTSTSYVPEQIHLSYAETPDSMYVVWTTPTATAQPYVTYSLNKSGAPTTTVQATTRTFTNDDWDIAPNTALMNYCAKMTGLQTGQLYKYQVGSSKGMSASFVFRALRDFTSSPAKLVFYGDLGVGPEQTLTLATLKTQASAYAYDAIFQIGDYAYNMNSNAGATGDEFFRDIQPVASILPYMGVQGNHEGPDYSGTPHWVNRFKMPGDNNNMWYSMDFGLVHVIGLSTELTYFNDPQQAVQYSAIQADLEAVDRSRTPWVVATFHRPMYCSINPSNDEDYYEDGPGPFTTRIKDCTISAPLIRKVWEDLLYKYKVDILMNAHVHTYERLNPAYNNQAASNAYTSLHLIKGAGAPLTIVTGMAGQAESYATLSSTPLPWSVAQSNEKGFGLLQAYNSSAILYQQLSSSDLSVLDYLWLFK